MNSILTRFDSSYEGLPAARFESAQEYEAFRLQVAGAGYSYKTKVVPAKAKRRPREIVLQLISTRASYGQV